ncbi:MAG: hypothetical protein AAB740_02985, partial [Patescibacteria group bacterium]
MEENKNQEFMPLAQAAKVYGVSQDYLRFLIFKKRLHGEKFGRNWVTTKTWLDEYFLTEDLRCKNGEIKKTALIQEKNDVDLQPAAIQKEGDITTVSTPESLKPLGLEELPEELFIDEIELPKRLINDIVDDATYKKSTARLDVSIVEKGVLRGSLEGDSRVIKIDWSKLFSTLKKTPVAIAVVFMLFAGGAFAKNFVYDQNLREGLRTALTSAKKSFQTAVHKTSGDIKEEALFLGKSVKKTTSLVVDMIDMGAEKIRERATVAYREVENVFQSAQQELTSWKQEVILSVNEGSQRFFTEFRLPRFALSETRNDLLA